MSLQPTRGAHCLFLKFTFLGRFIDDLMILGNTDFKNLIYSKNTWGSFSGVYPSCLKLELREQDPSISLTFLDNISRCWQNTTTPDEPQVADHTFWQTPWRCLQTVSISSNTRMWRALLLTLPNMGSSYPSFTGLKNHLYLQDFPRRDGQNLLDHDLQRLPAQILMGKLRRLLKHWPDLYYAQLQVGGSGGHRRLLEDLTQDIHILAPIDE